MTFDGKYFDGATPEGFDAKITLGNSHIHISILNNLSSKTIRWDGAKIHANDLAGSGKVYLKYGEFPFQYIEVSDARFSIALKECFPDAAFYKSRSWLSSRVIIALLAFLVATTGILLLSYFLLLPKIAERVALNLPIKWEIELGDAAYGKMVSAESVRVENTKRVNRFFEKLAYKSDYNIEIIVVKDSIINAFALPGGRIVVYEGIIGAMDDYTQLAALLSHEFSHVQLRHTTKSMVQSLSGYLMISLLFGDAGAVSSLIIQNANQLKELGYSRSLEEEADKNGFRLMKQRNIDPNGILRLFGALKKGEGNAEAIPQFLSTHPLTDSRISYIKNEIELDKFKWTADRELDSLWLEIKANRP